MEYIEKIRELLPDAAKDIRLNLGAVLEQSALDDEQKWGTAVASAYATRQKDLIHAIVAEATPHISAEVIEDAKAASVLMGMNNVLYRGRHFIGKEAYEKMPARLRMNRLAQPTSKKEHLELFSFAVSAINGCEVCMKAHEKTCTAAGLSEAQVFDALRIASVMHAAAVGIDLNV